MQAGASRQKGVSDGNTASPQCAVLLSGVVIRGFLVSAIRYRKVQGESSAQKKRIDRTRKRTIMVQYDV